MSNLNNIQRKISEGISGWLLFEFNCFRGYLFNEKYLSYPIGQILNSITELKTRTEQKHPCSNEGAGRPLQVDFALLDEEESWKYAFESKWIGNTSISLGDMIWDLIRLQNLFASHHEVKCYFILGGFDKKIDEFLTVFDLCYIPESIKESGITEVNETYMIFNLFKVDASTKTFLNGKLSSYPNMLFYSKIRCRPAHKFPKEDVVNMSFSTYVFEVMKPDETHKVYGF